MFAAVQWSLPPIWTAAQLELLRVQSCDFMEGSFREAKVGPNHRDRSIGLHCAKE